MNADLQQFVRESLARGITRPVIAERLREAGWRPEEIEAGLAAFADVEFPVPVPRRRPYLSAREAFLYLVLFATLYATAFNVGAVLFNLLDRWLPDRLQDARWGIGAIRDGTAALVIAFPIFVLLSASIGRSVTREPEKRGSRVRKWLTYVTLFLASLVLIGNSTVLVSKLLAGELAVRVLLKVLVVFAIAGTVFGHYLGELRRDEREGAPPQRELRLPPRLAVILVLAVVVTGLLASGSPVNERRRQLDARRLEDLRAIERQVTLWSWDHRRLPGALDELRASPTATGTRFQDPVSGRAYEYLMLDSLRYQLCAVFDTADSLADPGASEASVFWRHDRGRTCYTLEVPPHTLTHDRQPEPVGPRPGRP